MTSKKSYNRYFIIFQEDDRGFGIAIDKPPTGYTKIETRNEKCKITVYAQNLVKEKGPYTCCLIDATKNPPVVAKLGEISIDETGRGETWWEFKEDDIAGTGVPVDRFNVAAIIVEGDTILAPVSGYVGKDRILWKEKLVSKPRSSEEDETYITDEELDEEAKKFKEYEEQIKRDSEEEEIKAERSEDEKEGNAEGVEEKQDEAEKEFKAQAEPDQRRSSEKDNPDENKPANTEGVRPRDTKQKDASPPKSQESKSSPSSAAKPQADKSEGATQSKEGNVSKPQEVKSQGATSSPSSAAKSQAAKSEGTSQSKDEGPLKPQSSSSSARASSKPQSKDSNAPKSASEAPLSGGSKNAYTPVTRDEVRNIPGRLNEYDMEEVKEIKDVNPDLIRGESKGRKKYADMFNDVLKDFSPFEDVPDELRGTKWWLIPQRDDVPIRENQYYPYYCAIYHLKMTYPYINYIKYFKKSGHYYFGIKYDDNNEIKYIMYGIEGRNIISDQPYMGMTGFVRWVPFKDNERGMWIMYYNPFTGNIMIPKLNRE